MKIKSHFALALAMALSAQNNDVFFESPPNAKPKKLPKSKQPILSGLKHIGKIPKGCHLDKVVVDLEYRIYTIRVEFDIVSGSLKLFDKALEKKKREILNYIDEVGINSIKIDNRFKVTINENT